MGTRDASKMDFSRMQYIAEISCNHMNDRGLLDETIAAAFESGASMVKLQSSVPDSLTRPFTSKEFLVDNVGSPWHGMHLYELYERTCTPIEWPFEFIEKYRKIGKIVFSTPFSTDVAELLQSEVAPKLYKVSSIDWNYFDLIKFCLRTGAPLLISLVQPSQQCKVLDKNEIHGFIPMYCVSKYPALPEHFNIRELNYLSSNFDLFGFSDHSLTNSMSSLAVGQGARIIEKHFKLSDKICSDDAHFSVDPSGFRGLVNHCDEVFQLLDSFSEDSTIPVGRSLYADKDIKRGARITPADVAVIRPGGGLSCEYVSKIVGQIAPCDFNRGHRFSNDDLRLFV